MDENNFEKVLNDPNSMDSFFEKEKFQQDLDRYPALVEERNSKLMSTLRYGFERWIQQSLCLGWAFLEYFMPGDSPRLKKKRKHLRVLLGYGTAFCSFTFIFAPTVLALFLGIEFQGLFMFLTTLYAFYYSLGFSFPLAIGEAFDNSFVGQKRQDELYFLYNLLRYTKLRFQGREINGHTAYLTLTQSETASTAHVPLQYDQANRIRRESTMRKLKHVTDTNPYKTPLREQLVFVGVASFYAFFGWYTVILKRESLSDGETVCKLFGMAVKKSLLTKIILSFSAAAASALLRAGLQE